MYIHLSELYKELKANILYTKPADIDRAIEEFKSNSTGIDKINSWCVRLAHIWSGYSSRYWFSTPLNSGRGNQLRLKQLQAFTAHEQQEYLRAFLEYGDRLTTNPFTSLESLVLAEESNFIPADLTALVTTLCNGYRKEFGELLYNDLKHIKNTPEASDRLIRTYKHFHTNYDYLLSLVDTSKLHYTTAREHLNEQVKPLFYKGIGESELNQTILSVLTDDN